MIKRLADWLEKMSVAAFAVGIFQARDEAITLGIGTFAVSMMISWRLGRGSK